MVDLSMGMMRLPILEDDNFTSIDYNQVNEMVDLCIENGFNHFDTAYPYHEGLSEVAFRKSVVERYPRDSFTVSDKLPLFSITEESQLEPIFQEQLKRTGVEYFDYYLMHNVSGFSQAGWLDVDSFSFANKKKEDGYIKHLGLSTHADAEFLDNILTAHPEMEFVLLQINYLDWENPGVESKKCYEVACKHNKPIWIMEPFKGGFLADVPGLYNNEKIQNLGDWTAVGNAYVNYSKLPNVGIASDCIECEACMDECPQHINIPEVLKDVEKTFETEYYGFK